MVDGWVCNMRFGPNGPLGARGESPFFLFYRLVKDCMCASMGMKDKSTHNP